MIYKNYDEFYTFLNEKLPNFEIILGTSKELFNKETCFISHRNSEMVYSDNTPLIASTTYDLIILQKRAAFTNKEIIEITNDGVDFNVYDEESGFNIFTASVTLYGSRSVPNG